MPVESSSKLTGSADEMSGLIVSEMAEGTAASMTEIAPGSTMSLRRAERADLMSSPQEGQSNETVKEPASTLKVGTATWGRKDGPWGVDEISI